MAPRRRLPGSSRGMALPRRAGYSVGPTWGWCKTSTVNPPGPGTWRPGPVGRDLGTYDRIVAIDPLLPTTLLDPDARQRGAEARRRRIGDDDALRAHGLEDRRVGENMHPGVVGREGIV